MLMRTDDLRHLAARALLLLERSLPTADSGLRARQTLTSLLSEARTSVQQLVDAWEETPDRDPATDAALSAAREVIRGRPGLPVELTSLTRLCRALRAVA